MTPSASSKYSESAPTAIAVSAVPDAVIGPPTVTPPAPLGVIEIVPSAPSAIVITPELVPPLVLSVRSPVPLVVITALALLSPTRRVFATTWRLPSPSGVMVICVSLLPVPTILFDSRFTARVARFPEVRVISLSVGGSLSSAVQIFHLPPSSRSRKRTEYLVVPPSTYCPYMPKSTVSSVFFLATFITASSISSVWETVVVTAPVTVKFPSRFTLPAYKVPQRRAEVPKSCSPLVLGATAAMESSFMRQIGCCRNYPTPSRYQVNYMQKGYRTTTPRHP